MINIGFLLSEAAWPSCLGRLICNLKVPGSNTPPYCYLDLLAIVPSSTPRLRCVNSQLVSLPRVGILISLCSICNVWLLIYSVPNRELFLYPSKNYLLIYTQLLENLEGRMLKSIITWSEMGQQTAQTKKVN